eukprot:1146423-Pelagomonas_calceolata.AAC.5
MPHHSDIISQKQRTKAVCVLEPCAEESIVVDAPSHHRSIASMSSSGSPDVTRSLIFPYHQMSPDLVLFQVTSSNLVLFQLSRSSCSFGSSDVTHVFPLGWNACSIWQSQRSLKHAERAERAQAERALLLTQLQGCYLCFSHGWPQLLPFVCVTQVAQALCR